VRHPVQLSPAPPCWSRAIGTLIVWGATYPGTRGVRTVPAQLRRAYRRGMRIESSVTSLSWIPSEAIKGMTKMPFEVGVAHYDETPPDVIDDLGALRDADRFRFANQLSAWIEVEDGRITGFGQ